MTADTDVSEPDGEPIVVLHVDDDPEFVDLVVTCLEREHADIEVVTATDADEGLDRLDGVDCVVSDYEMPGMDGLEFLEAVRERDPDLPFILFTGRGSEEIASEAISAGVTDYLQKGGGLDQYAVLANRIDNLVSRHRARREVETTRRRFEKLVEHSSDIIFVVDDRGITRYITPSVEHILDYTPDELIGESAFDLVHPDDLDQAVEAFEGKIEDPDDRAVVEFRARRADGSWRWLEVRGRNLLADPDVEGFVVNARDVTDRVERERALERQNQRLEEFGSLLSHELRGPLARSVAAIDMVRETGDDDYLDDVERAHDRMEELIDGMLALAREGRAIGGTEPVPLASAAGSAWEAVGNDAATLRVENGPAVEADADRLRQLLENLLGNAVEHGGEGVTVRVGTIDETGFFVEDDGRGIEEEERERVFELGHSTADDGTGLGLAIVREIAKAHGWEVAVADREGGARFEVTGVTFA